MIYQFNFRPYQRLFQRPMQTSHGIWTVRQGIVIRLTDEIGKVGWGEVAPIPRFGSETWKEAIDFCQQLPSIITSDIIDSIPDNLPACQFGIETAMVADLILSVHPSSNPCRAIRASEFKIQVVPSVHPRPNPCRAEGLKVTYCGLLPSGEACLQAWKPLWNRGYRTFKWKMGVRPFAEEVKIFDRLIKSLPIEVKLRLDANGGLSLDAAKRWLEKGDRANNPPPNLSDSPVTTIEFLEQPLAPEKFDEMQQLAQDYSTPIALDESVATLNQLEACYQRGWRGIFVIKAGIAGSPSRLRQFLRSHSIDTVFSSVMETSIGRTAAIALAVELQKTKFALGFGIDGWFAEDEEQWLHQLWND